VSSLSPQQFPRLFHGSISDLRGTHLQPGGFGGASGGQDEWKHLGQSKRDYVSATEHEDTAWNFSAKAAAQGMSTGRRRVYEVEPNEQTKMGIEHVDHPVLQKAFDEKWFRKPQPAGEFVSPQFKVIAQHDTQPGAQGTFPSVDWNAHKAKGTIGDTNHPAGPRPQYAAHEAEAYREQRKRKTAARQDPRTSPQKEILF